MSDPAELGEKLARGELDELPEGGDVSVEAQVMAEFGSALVEEIKGLKATQQQLATNIDENTAVLSAAAQAQNKTDAPGADDEPEETDTTVTSEHEYDADEMEERVYSWVQDAGGILGNLFTDVVEVEFAEVDGNVGLKIEGGKPWNSPCHSGNEWTDKDRWDKHMDDVRSLTDRDEMDYHGEPDYFNFLPAGRVEEVTG